MLANLCKLCCKTTEQSILKITISRFATRHLKKASLKKNEDDKNEHYDFLPRRRGTELDEYEDRHDGFSPKRRGAEHCKNEDKNYGFAPKRGGAEEAEEPEPPAEKPKRPLIIKCKRPEFNFYQGDTYPKFKPIPLASRSWQHRNSKGDYFTIYPLEEGEKEHEINESLSFQDINLNPDLVKNLENDDFLHPTAIQRLGIPRILENKNVILTAETGSGKTYAFLIPMLEQVLKWKPMMDRGCNRPLGLILTPSHELTKQIAKVAKKLSKDLGINIVTLTGGRTKRMIHNPPVSEVDIVVATIGVMSKLVGTGIFKLDEVKHVVLDEADTMFDETFCDFTCSFLRKVPISARRDEHAAYPTSAQITLNSATIPQGLPDSLYQVVDGESFLTVTTGNEHQVRVPQKFFRLGGSEKPMTLLKLVKPKVKSKIPIIIFSNTTSTCDFTSLFLKQFNIKCINLHGNQPIEYRRGKFIEFQQGICNILTTTDAGARGLDTCSAKNVINFDFPLITAEYIHRCGRVGRIGSPQDCRVINFISRPLEIILTKKIEFAIRKGNSIPMVDMIHQGKEYEDEFIGSHSTKEEEEEVFNPAEVKEEIDKMSLGNIDSRPYRIPQ